MEFRLIGVILVSVGTGMLIVEFFPWWGFLAAAALVAVGIYIIIRRC